MFWHGQSYVTYAIWTVLAVAIVVALVLGDLPIAFVGTVTLGLTIVPLAMAERFHLKIPIYFYAYMVVFLFGTVFLGEAYDFYTRFWWWDLVLHGSSAVGFGIIGVVFTLLMFEGDRYAAPPFAVAIVAFSIALSIGALWEIFEFAMDQLFGTNMQKSGLTDTMTDLMVDTLGAAIGAATGWAYLRGRDRRGLPGVIADFVKGNKRLVRRKGHMLREDVEAQVDELSSKADRLKRDASAPKPEPKPKSKG